MIYQQLSYFIDSFFVGLKLFIPLLFLLYLFRHFLEVRIYDRFKMAAVWLTLISGILFFILVFSNVLYLKVTNSVELEFIVGIAIGPTWYQLAGPVFSFGVLPLLFFSKKIRNHPTAIFMIATAWYIISMWVDFLTERINGYVPIRDTSDYVDYVKKLTIFVIGYLITFSFIKKRERKSREAGVEK